jgi:hypothetical protein
MLWPARLTSITVLLLVAVSAHAQPGPAAKGPVDAAGAATLFKEGREAAKRGDYAAAHPKLAESLRLDPATGTLINLADCEEHLGRLASAWQHYGLAGESLPRDDDRLPLVQKRIAALSPRLPRLTVVLAAGAPREATVTRDGVELGAGSLGAALPVDPGQHTITVAAPGRAKQSFPASIREGEAKQIEVGPGPPLPPGGGGVPPQPGRGPLWTIGFVSAGIGVAGVGAAIGTGVAILGDHAAVVAGCPKPAACNQDGYDAAQRGKTLTPINAAAWAVGAVGLGVGVTLIVVGRKPPSPSAGLLVLPGGAAIGGSF